MYDILYCRRGEAENRIKEAQLGLFATRTSCQYFDADQFRILLSALAYTLVERLRTLALKGTPLAKAQIHTLRNQLLKLAAVIIKNYASYPALLCESLAECVDLADGAACVEQRIAAAKAAGRRDVKNQARPPCREGGGVGRHPARQKNRSVCRCQCVKKADPSEHQGQHGRKKYHGEICGLAGVDSGSSHLRQTVVCTRNLRPASCFASPEFAALCNFWPYLSVLHRNKFRRSFASSDIEAVAI